MAISLILALGAFVHGGRFEPVAGNNVWEETAFEQKLKEKIGEYCPKLRFNRESTYMFATPDFIQQGKYSVEDNHYYFKAIMANELENSDVNKLAPEMGAGVGQKFREAYARSMSNFEADYNSKTGELILSYPVKGMLKTFHLLPFSNPAGLVAVRADDPDLQNRTLWHAPEPFPDKMTARDRNRFFGLEGLQQFMGEASASDGAQFALLDLRPSHAFRAGSTVGRWTQEGTTLTLMADGGRVQFTIVDGQKLVSGGKTKFIIN